MRNLPTFYVVIVRSTERGRKIIVNRNFVDYDKAIAFLDQMEAMYSDGYTVEFDTVFAFKTV